MDQVRAIVGVIWTQRFWVLGVIATIVSVVCWNMASGKLQSEFSSRKSAIDSAYNSVNSIKGEHAHPNDTINDAVMRQAKQQRDFVRSVWKELYEEQRSKVLFWPANIGEEFVNYMENRKFRDPISSTMRGFYLNYIGKRFDALLEIVKAQKDTSGRAGLGGRGGRGGEFGGEFGGRQPAPTSDEDDDYLVQWLDQARLQQKLHFETPPSSTQVWVTQEDLWVYETLLHVIADTNKARGATRPDNTAVRVIVSLEVGRAASPKSTGTVYIPVQSEGGDLGGRGGEYGELGGYGGGEFGGYGGGEFGGRGGEYGGGEFGGYGGGEFGGRGGEYGGRGGEGGGGDEALLANRYLDSEGNPDPGTGDTVGSAEFRQLPIRMNLMMDERWIPRILIECANAALPVEVKQLRINPDKAGGNFGGRATGGRGSRIRGLSDDANLADVEIRGVVYIYNPPATEQLTIPGDDEAAGADEVAVN